MNKIIQINLYQGLICIIVASASLAAYGQQMNDDSFTVQKTIIIPKRHTAADIKYFSVETQIERWEVQDEDTLLIETTRGDFIATFAGGCPGLISTDEIGFTYTGHEVLSKFTTIILSNGERCFIENLLDATEGVRSLGTRTDSKRGMDY